MSWPWVALIALACLLLGAGIAYLAVMFYFSKGMWQ